MCLVPPSLASRGACAGRWPLVGGKGSVEEAYMPVRCPSDGGLPHGAAPRSFPPPAGERVCRKKHDTTWAHP